MNHVLILSYNRPKMLKEAIQSVLDNGYEDFIIDIVDDGSYFDPFDIDERVVWHKQEILMGKARVGRVVDNINSVLSTLESKDIVFYLCDDDLMPPQWMERVTFEFQKYHLGMHMIIGQLWFFKEDLSKLAYDKPDSYKQWRWAVGSMAHRACCFLEEGIVWQKNDLGHSFDKIFHDEMLKNHQRFLALEQPALYKRQHAKSLGNIMKDSSPIIDWIME